ncbi:TetR family transcriptional regulator [Rhizobium sp. ERR 922]|uniref:TetR/AcrR family transcriptional regulator n=1 Tax=unclassified Rhizobium TaxID=2613769 RepID=UPI0011A58680|nr:MULTISPECIES: TetR/AcrR family transcriptional regulator [unclassified Rhizobium]TWB53107.1 TetR family transcriptional regulator [Rhizobium sp. ERR 922]TWB95928.1 TetR family transcriptional regulator [Rhizobium sp. ERR 942]
MFRMCTDVTTSGAKEKTKGSASAVSDAYWASDRQASVLRERGSYSSASDQAILEKGRDRILDIAERYIRHIGHRKTTVADIASDLGTSRANVYRFFPTKAAIDNSVCERLVRKVAEIAFSIARTDASASKKLVELLNFLHLRSSRTLMEERPIHELFVAATNENWATMNTHNQQMRAVLAAIMRQGQQAGEFQLEDADDTTRGVITAFLPFFHPVLVEQGIQEWEDMAGAAHAQIRFIMRALGKSDWANAEIAEAMISA